VIVVSTSIKTEPQAQAAMLDTLKNPPKSPVQAFQWLTKNVNMSAAFGKTIGGLIPGVGSVLGSLTDIFSAFSSAPSLGEIVLDGLSQLSTQITELKSELTKTIEKTAEIQTQKTVDYVLQGVDEIQQEVSALQIMQSMTNEAAIQQMAIEKNQAYAEYLAEYEKIQSAAYRELSDIINQVQADLETLYNAIILRFGELGFDLFGFIKKLTEAPQAESAAPVQRSVPTAQAQPKTEEKEPFNWLYLSPLLLLLFANKKKRFTRPVKSDRRQYADTCVFRVFFSVDGNNKNRWNIGGIA